jgi:diketogulonate reductase-like aldo/keto reductase
MEECYNKGLAKAIGLSNVTPEQIERVMKIAKVPVHNVQVSKPI